MIITNKKAIGKGERSVVKSLKEQIQTGRNWAGCDKNWVVEAVETTSQSNSWQPEPRSQIREAVP